MAVLALRQWNIIAPNVRSVALALVLAVLLAHVGRAAEVKEYDIKAAYVYNFAKFTEWPADAFAKPNSPFVIGIVGKDPFGPMIDKAFESRNVSGRPFIIKRLKWDQDIKGCHVLFVSSSESSKIGQMGDLLKGAPVLTVGETSGFAQRGGVINFFVEEEKVKFEINLDAAKRANLTISTKLLSLAKIVKEASRS